jgi:hypothetical protein
LLFGHRMGAAEAWLVHGAPCSGERCTLKGLRPSVTTHKVLPGD